jgi:hypothetical protein
VRQPERHAAEGGVRRLAYTARVHAADGTVTTHLTRGSDAGSALTNLRRQLLGRWSRIEVGTGEGEAFRVLMEVAQ